MAFRVRRIHKAKDFVGLEPVWSRLAGGSDQTSLVRSHDWLWCCWHGAWPHRRPEILVVEDAGDPVAVVPLMAWKERIHGLPVRLLGFLECADSASLDILSVAEPRAVIDAVLDHLGARSDWDVFRFRKLLTTSPTLKALESSLHGRFLWRPQVRQLWPVLRITGNWATMLAAARRQPLTAAYERLRERLDGAGRVVTEEHRTPECAAPLLDEMLSMPGADPASRPGPTPLPRLPEFFKALTRRAGAADRLSLWLLRLDGQLIAAEYQLRLDRRAYAIRHASDPAYAALSPASALNAAIVRAFFDGGEVLEYDMGVGLTDYKLRWTPDIRETVDLTVYRSTVYARLLYRMENGSGSRPGVVRHRRRTAFAAGFQ